MPAGYFNCTRNAKRWRLEESKSYAECRRDGVALPRPDDRNVGSDKPISR
jgi:hypothetical protein